MGGYDTGGIAYDVQVAGTYAYVAAGEAGLQVIDLTNPANLRHVGSYDTGGQARGIQVVGNYAYLADGDAGLQVIDIRNPANPTDAGRYDTSGNARGVHVWENCAFVADGAVGMVVLRIKMPGQPVAPRFEPTRLRLSPSGFLCAFATEPGVNYGIEISEDLIHWRAVGIITATSTESEHLDLTAPGAAHRFYRVKALR